MEVVLMEVPVMLPELVTVKLPPPVVTRAPLRTKFTPTKVMPAAPFELRSPASCIVPVEVAFKEARLKS